MLSFVYLRCSESEVNSEYQLYHSTTRIVRCRKILVCRAGDTKSRVLVNECRCNGRHVISRTAYPEIDVIERIQKFGTKLGIHTLGYLYLFY